MTTADSDRTFDWVPSRDPRNLLYPLRSTLPRRITYRHVHWGLPSLRLDQGPDGACVGYACVNEALASPVRVKVPSYVEACNLAYDVYRTAQAIDEWPGENYEGTSVNAGAQVMRARGYIGGWAWAQTLDDIRAALCTPARAGGGPVVFGSPWYDSMFTPGRGSLLQVDGWNVGGHAYLVVGWHPNRRIGSRRIETFTILNSWGPEWGRRGMAYIAAEDMERLFSQGEAAVFTDRAIPAVST